MPQSVAPHAGAWIEMVPAPLSIVFPQRRSPCGSEDRNHQIRSVKPSHLSVALHAGAWIEIRQMSRTGKNDAVAPHMGAWIEIWIWYTVCGASTVSLPMWERG